MRRHRDGEINDLVRNTIIWIAVVIPLVSAIAVGAWVGALRKR